MRRTGYLLPAMAFLAYAAVPAQASAQESTTRGFNLGFHASAATLVVEKGDPSTGGGGGIRVGYGFNRNLTLFFGIDGAQVDVESQDLAGTWAMAHGDLGVRFHFSNTLRSWVPYLEAAIGGRAVSVTDAAVDQQQAAGTVSFSGAAFTLGGGISVYLKESLALDLGLKFSGGQFTKIDVGALSLGGLDIDATSTRFNIGVAWWP